MVMYIADISFHLAKINENYKRAYIFIWRKTPPVGQGLLIHEISRSNKTMRHRR